MMTGESKDSKRTPHVVIVGAGLAGISAAIQLKRQLSFKNFTIYERADSVGGTWRDHSYPGCGSDIPAHWYSLSTDLNPDWDSYYVNQPELRIYWESLWKKHDLAPHTKLSTRVSSAEWDNKNMRYKVTLEDEKSGQESTVEAEVVIWAVGDFSDPLFPKELEPGVKKFKGIIWHSARWNHNVELTGKRIGVIGNGCSAVQLIPKISEDPSVRVVNFCRTPQWFIPRANFKYPLLVKWVFRYVPFVMRWYRNSIMARADFSALIFRKDNKLLLSATKRMITRYIEHHAPKKDLEKLIPTYPPGCKRIIVDPDYLKSLHRPNVSLKWDRIEEIVEEGIRLKTGEVVPLDIIIFGTGYSFESKGMRVKGSNGKTVQEYFDGQGGATAYLGSSFPGFPNFYALPGPNVATGHSSIMFAYETQINLALQLIKPVVDGKAKAFEISNEETEKYNEWLQNRLQGSVWVDCMSSYRVDRKFGRIVAAFPGPATLFWWLSRKPKWGRYLVVGGGAWETERKRLGYLRVALAAVVAVLSIGLGLTMWLAQCTHPLGSGVNR